MELLVGGVGTTTPLEDMIKEKVCMLLHSKVRAKVKEKEKEIVTLADRPGLSLENVHTRKKARAKKEVARESVTTAARRVIPQGSVPKAKKEEKREEKETVIKAKAKERGTGERVCGRLTERNQESGHGNSQKKKSQQGALGQ